MNPFDQFSGALNDALPSSNGSVAPTVISQQQPPQQQQQFNLMAQPTPEKKPVMNTGMMMPNQQQQPPQGGGMYGQQQPTQGMYGQTQIQPPGGMYGQAPVPPPQQQMMAPTQSMMGGFGQMNSNGSMGVPSPTPNSNGMGAAPAMQQQLTNQPSQNNVMAGALVPSTQQSNPYALGGAADAAAANPFGAPQQNNQLQQQQQPNPFGATQVTPQTSGQMMAMDPFGTAANNQPPPAQQQQLAAVDPWGSQPTNNMGGGASVVPSVAPVQQQSNALVPSGAPPSDDPFGVFGGGGSQSVAPSVAAPSAIGGAPSVSAFGDQTVISQQQYQQQPPAQQQQQAQQPPSVIGGGNDPWAEMGFGSPAPAPSGPVPGEDDDLFNTGLQPTREAGGSAAPPKPPVEQSTPKSPSKKKNKPGELPPGGEWYDAKIFTPTLGVMFFKPKELVDSLFLQTDKKMVDQLEERPVVAFIVEGSSARSAGVELGHVLLKVNGIDVKNPKEASRLIKEGPRPLPLLFYVPETNVVVAEGEHMVKYNTKETGAPNSAKDWKPKYVVIGGIIAQPWMMNMYRSKSEYDIAVIETQARRPVSVKVKQFSLQGARIQNDWQGPQMVKYKNKLHPWKYIVILPISRNPIKIASPNLSQLKPVHEGIRRVLQSQQRDRGGGGRGAGPSRGQDSYGGGGYDTRGRNGNDHRGRGY